MNKFKLITQHVAVGTAIGVAYIVAIPTAIGIGIWAGIVMAYKEIRTK